MSEPSIIATDPRWGSQDRSKKAETIWQTMLHYAGPSIQHGCWLDIGCGSGGIAAHIAPRVSTMLGMDPEPWTRWQTLACSQPNLKFLHGGYDHQPALLPPASVDVVICNQVYEHVPDPCALIEFIHRILKPGGYCYFAGPNLLFPIEPHVYWPFVHWLPRRWSKRLMRMLGSTRGEDLDAFSTHVWQLKAWLRPHFQLANAVPFILREVLPAQHCGRFWRTLARVPEQVFKILNPLSPGFVFVLKKIA